MKKQDLLLEQWKQAAELYRQENELIWHRFNYFIVINGALLSTVAAVWFSNTANRINPQVGTGAFVIALFGVIASSFWALTQRRGQLYHRYRAAQARHAEELLTIENERVLTIFKEDLSGQNLVPAQGTEKWAAQTMVFWLAVFLTLFWSVLSIFFAVSLLDP